VKIQGWFVERFGALRHYEVRDLPNGLTVFCGPNGSGKSTLVAFIRQMLFGRWRQGTDGRGFMPPAEWSGRLHIAGQNGAYTITRKAEGLSQTHVARPDGGEAGAAEFEHLFGGPDARVIGSLLSFDINDLQAFPALTNPTIRERLFPSGAGRTVRSIQRALDAVRIRKAEMTRRAADETQKLATDPADLQARIDRSTRAAARLGQLLQTQAQAQLTFDLRTRTIADLKVETAKYDALVDLAPVWQELTQARRELDMMPPVEALPSDFEQRLDQALAARQAAQRTVTQLVGHERPARREAPAPAEERHVNVSEDLTGWQRRLKEAVDTARNNERQFEMISQTVRELEQTRNEIAAALSTPEPPTTAVLEEEARLVQQVRTTLAGLESDQAFTKRWQDQIAERSAAIRTLESDVVSIPWSSLFHLAWLAGGASVGIAVWRYLEGDLVGSAALGGGALVSTILAFVQRSRRHSAIAQADERLLQLGAARDELERACQSLLHHQERAARRRFDISVDSVRLGLPPLPTDLQLKEREAELEAQRRHRIEWDRAQAELADNQSSLARNQEIRRQQAQALTASQSHERLTVQQWNQWKMHAGSQEGAAPARGLSEPVRSESELLETCRRLRVQIAEWEQNANDWNTRARAALGGVAEAEPLPAPPSAAVGVAVAVAPAGSEASPAVQAARRRLRHCEDAVSQLFLQAGVSDEDAFRARVGASKRRTALAQTVRNCEARCSERLRREMSADAIQREISDINVEEWRRRSARAAAELTSLESARDDVMRQLRQLDADIAAASAESGELPVLEAERSALATEAAATLRTSRTLVVAAALLEDALHHMERESQPPALRRASETLSAITFSRYERVSQSDDERDLMVLDGRNGWVPTSQLSRGAIEQLYFSLRVGLAEESAQRGPRLPIVIDDVLDQFDPKRSQAIARQLVELSRRHQVFVFTRRPETCDLLRHLDPTVNLLTLQEL